MKKTDIWMPMFWGDYLKDTMHLSTTEHGAYLLLIAHHWNTGKPIPAIHSLLQNITKTTPHIFKKISPEVLKFFTLEDGAYHHPRVMEELEIAAENKQSLSERGKKAAAARWQKCDACGNAHALADGCPSPSPSPSSMYINTSGKSEGIIVLKFGTYEKARKIAPDYDIYYIENAWKEWMKEKGKRPDNPDAAFLGFVKVHIADNPL